MAARHLRKALLPAVLLAALAAPAGAEITKQNVLLIVNLDSADSMAIRDAYRTQYGDDVRAWEYHGSTAVTIERTTFESEIRARLDDYLRNTLDDQGQPLYKTIRVLVTTKGVPRRVWDIDGHTVGDNANVALSQFSANKYDAASVDSELSLVHQDLKPGAAPLPDNYANNCIHNPYQASTQRIDAYSRAYTTQAKSFQLVENCWENASGPIAQQLLPGDIYLVTRLSGYTTGETVAALGRAGRIPFDKYRSTVVIDRDAVKVLDDDGPYSQGEDFPETRDMLLAAEMHADYDSTALFVSTAGLPVVGYASYGVNHDPRPPTPVQLYILRTLHFTLCRGAVFNTYESFNGRNFEAVDPNDPLQHDAPFNTQGQVADWIHIGGTLGMAHVFEPFAFTVADNEILYERLLVRGWTFAEAAYASLPVLSFQNIVVGDPLATFEPLGEVDQWQVVARHGASSVLATAIADGYVEPRAQGLQTLAARFTRDVDPATVTPGVVTLAGQTGGDQSGLIQSLELDASHRVLTIGLAAALPDGDRYTVTIGPAVTDAEGLPFTGRTTLNVSALVGDVDSSGVVTGADLMAVRGRIGQALTSANARYDVNGSGAITGGDMLRVRAESGRHLP